MKRISRIFEDRIFGNKSLPFKVLEKRLVEALELERKIMILELGKRSHELAKKQFIVFIISCFESFMKDMFKLMIDKGVIPIEKLLEIEKLRKLKFNLEELVIIKKEKIKISEIVSNEINFQNFNEILKILSLIEFDKYYKLLSPKFINGDAGFTKEDSEKAILNLYKTINKKISNNPELIKYMDSKSARDFFKSSKSAKIFFTAIVRNLYRAPSLEDKDKILGTIKLGIQIRHVIVHKATDIKLPHKVFHLALFLSILRLAAVIQEIYNIKTKKVLSPP